MNIITRLIEVFEPVIINDKYKKRNFVCKGDGQYDKEMCFELFHNMESDKPDKTGYVDQFKVGDMLEIEFDVESRRWQRDAMEPVKFFTTLKVFKVFSQSQAMSQRPQVQAPDIGSIDNDDSEVPF